jgi:hypothetical protein
MDGGGAMQNSAVMTLRSLVLLACFIAVPLFAIFGRDTPDVLREFFHNLTSRATKGSSSPTSNSPMFRPATGADSAAPVLPGASAPPLQSNPAATNRAAPAPPNSPTPGQVAPASATSPASASGGAATSLPPVTQGDGATSGVRHAGGATVGAQQTAPKQSVYVQTPGQPAVTSVSASAANFPPEYFREAEGRLRRLGATYYLLESLTPAGDNYRFFCKVAGSQPEAVVAFVATDSDPLRAMNTVVRQIETWRGQAQ